MEASKLLKEARRIARPSVELSSRAEGEPVGFWGAHGTERDGGSHLFSVDLSLLGKTPAPLPTHGTMQLFWDLKGRSSSQIFFQDRALDFTSVTPAFASVKRSIHPYTGAEMPPRRTWGDLRRNVILLYARQAVSLPCPNDLFRFGSDELRIWANEINWDPEQGWPDVEESSPLSEYIREYLSSVWGPKEVHSTPPVAANDSLVRFGGWQYPQDGEVSYPGELVLTAFASGEPLIEVRSLPDGEFAIIERTT